MKISTRGRYAVMAMADMAQMAKSGASGPVALSDISDRQEISLHYLEQIFGDLRRAGLVESRRGKNGGYLLAAPLEAIRIGDVISAVDEPVDVTRCGAAAGCLKKSGRCLTHDLWAHLGGTIHGFLNSISLDDLVNGRLPQVFEAAR